MKFEYTLAELSTAITALEQVYGKVSVLDPYRGTVLDPATLQPTDKAEELTALDETGRGVQLAQSDDVPGHPGGRPPLRADFPLLHAPQSAILCRGREFL